MFKLLSRTICLVVFAIIAFVALSLKSGGEKFRWLGSAVKQESEKVGEKADAFKEKSQKVVEGIEKTKGAIEGLTGKKDEKSR